MREQRTAESHEAFFKKAPSYLFNGVLSTPLRESLSFLVFALTVYSLQVMVDQHQKNADKFFLYKPVWAFVNMPLTLYVLPTQISPIFKCFLKSICLK